MSPAVPTFLYMRWDDLRPGPAQKALARFFDPATDDGERVQLARKVLALDAPTAHCMLFDTYRRMRMGARFSASNPLEELLGVLRVRALAILRRPARSTDATRNKQAAAATVIADVARPKDIPLLLSVLDNPAHPEVPHFLYWALRKAVEDLESSHPALIDAMERRLRPGHEGREDRVEASRLLADHRVPAAEAALVRALAGLPPIEAIPVAMALLSHDPVQHLDRARRVRDALPEGYPREEQRYGMAYEHSLFLQAIETAEQEGSAEMAARARLAEVKATLEARPEQALAPLLSGLRREDLTALTPTLCRLLSGAGDAAAPDILRALGHHPATTRTFFHAIEPWLSNPDLEIRRLAMLAVLASGSDQARARLVARLRRSCVADADDACTILSALSAEDPLQSREAALGMASPFPEVRALAERAAREPADD